MNNAKGKKSALCLNERNQSRRLIENSRDLKRFEYEMRCSLDNRGDDPNWMEYLGEDVILPYVCKGDGSIKENVYQEAPKWYDDIDINDNDTWSSEEEDEKLWRYLREVTIAHLEHETGEKFTAPEWAKKLPGFDPLVYAEAAIRLYQYDIVKYIGEPYRTSNSTDDRWWREHLLWEAEEEEYRQSEISDFAKRDPEEEDMLVTSDRIDRALGNDFFARHAEQRAVTKWYLLRENRFATGHS